VQRASKPPQPALLLYTTPGPVSPGFEARRWRSSHLSHRTAPAVVEVRAQRASKPPQPALLLYTTPGPVSPGFEARRWRSSHLSHRTAPTVVEVRVQRASKPPQPALLLHSSPSPTSPGFEARRWRSSHLSHRIGSQHSYPTRVPAPPHQASRLVAGAPHTSATGSAASAPTRRESRPRLTRLRGSSLALLTPQPPNRPSLRRRGRRTLGRLPRTGSFRVPGVRASWRCGSGPRSGRARAGRAAGLARCGSRRRTA
jgi:hypothetical protein